MKRLILSVCTALIAAPVAAYQAPNGHRVDGSAQEITVYPLAGAGGAQIVCAAAFYAEERLGAEPADRVVVTGPRAKGLFKGAGETVVFKVSADAKSDHGLLISVTKSGVAVSIAHAKTFCESGGPGERG